MKNWKFLSICSILLAGCGGVAGAAVPAWNANMRVDVPTVKVGRNWRSTLNILPTTAQNKALYDAWQNGMSNCMEQNGFTYEPGVYYDESWVDNWNPLDEKWGNQFGYHNPKTDFPQPEQSSDVKYQSMLEQTCAPEANKSTYGLGDVMAFTTELDRVINDVMKSIAEPGKAAEKSLESKWSSCMANQGLDYENRNDLVQAFQGRSRISNEELKAKGVDIACDRQVGMTASRSAAEESALNSWKLAHKFDLENLQRLRPAFNAAVAGL